MSEPPTDAERVAQFILATATPEQMDKIRHVLLRLCKRMNRALLTCSKETRNHAHYLRFCERSGIAPYNPNNKAI